LIELLCTPDREHLFGHPRSRTDLTHGTGCPLASAIAAGIARGLELRESVQRATDYVHEAIRRAPGYGGGHGPLDHGHTMRSDD